MARFMTDQDQIALFLESGTYGSTSGNAAWPGLVQSHDIPQAQNVIQIRHLGASSRNVNVFAQGPEDIEGTLTFFPQDWRMLGFALGSITTTSGTAQNDNYQHELSEASSSSRHNAFTSGTLNPWISFTVEDARDGPVDNKNSVRTFNGCVPNTYSINVTQSEPVSVELGFMAQTGSFTSGAISSVTAGSNRPYLWSDVTWEVPGGTNVIPVKSLSFNVNNNFTGPHYINGSRIIDIPYPGNREYSVEVTQDMDDTTIGSFWHTYYLGGSKFNAVLDVDNTNNTGSHHLIVTLSGCVITEMTPPVDIGGVNEMTYTVVPGSVSAIAHDRIPLYTPF